LLTSPRFDWLRVSAGLGNPGPLGLGAFALTTMTLSIYNAGILTDTSGVVVAVALFYGGIAQFIAGTTTTSDLSIRPFD
jgi:succinate-acetate transporter protein